VASLAIWDDCIPTTELACLMVSAGVSGSIIFSTTVGITYYVQIQRRSGNNNNDMDGNICVEEYTLPSNDEPCSAINLTVNTSCTFLSTTTGDPTASAGIPAPGCGGSTYNDVWYSFTVPASGNVEITTAAGTLTDAVMAIYSGSCGSLTLIECDDDDGAGLMPYIYRTGLTPGNTIWVRVWGYGGAEGTFDICVTNVQTPGDNPCSSTTILTSSSSCDYTTWTNVGATNTTGSISPATPSCADLYNGEDVWYNIVVPSTGNIVISTLEGTLTDGAVAIYESSTGTCSGTLTEVNCNEDKNFALLEWMPLLYDTTLTPGDSIWIRFWGYNGANGNYGICVIEVPDPSLNQDCDNPRQLCDDATVGDNSSGSGSVVDLDNSNEGCLVNGESQSAWYGIQFETGGTFTFTIDPIINESDFDFAVWGPTDLTSCPPSATPIRCSWALNAGATGLVAGAGDDSEDANGDGFVNSITVGDGEIYFIMVDNYSTNYTGFNISFGGTAIINCNILPVTLLSFSATSVGLENLLQWSTATEINNDYYEVQKSHDGVSFVPFGKIPGAGNSTETIYYSYVDAAPFPGITYYRLKQVDYNGMHDYSKIVAVKNDIANYFNVFPNPSADGNITIRYSGFEQPFVQLTIYNATGQEIFAETVAHPEAFNQMQFKLPARGMYTVVFSAGNYMDVKKVVY
ncbi:MAG: T9SS type A sorting domain-containing protein, partial [Chitinophagales bacterium]